MQDEKQNSDNDACDHSSGRAAEKEIPVSPGGGEEVFMSEDDQLDEKVNIRRMYEINYRYL